MELQKFFTLWKQSNYQGAVIPDVSSGLNCDRFPQLSPQQVRDRASARQLQHRSLVGGSSSSAAAAAAPDDKNKSRCIIM